MNGLTTHNDPLKREDMVGKKSKVFDKKTYWNTKRSEKNKAKKRKK